MTGSADTNRNPVRPCLPSHLFLKDFQKLPRLSPPCPPRPVRRRPMRLAPAPRPPRSNSQWSSGLFPARRHGYPHRPLAAGGLVGHRGAASAGARPETRHSGSPPGHDRASPVAPGTASLRSRNPVRDETIATPDSPALATPLEAPALPEVQAIAAVPSTRPGRLRDRGKGPGPPRFRRRLGFGCGGARRRRQARPVALDFSG